MTTNGGGLTLREFALLLDRLGPVLNSWPSAERAAAERLVAADAEAGAMLSAAASVDGALRLLMQNGTAPLRTRHRQAAWAPSWRRLAGFGMAALAASLAIGFVVGAALPAPDDDDASGAVFMAVNDTDLGGVL